MAHLPVPDRLSSAAGTLAERAGEAGSAAWRSARANAAPLAPLVVGAVVGLAAFALLSARSGERRGRQPKEGYAATIATLNNLVAISHDGADGFRTAAAEIPTPHIKEIFERAARRCEQGAAELQRKVRKLGGRPEQIGTVSGAAHRAWVNVKAAITGQDEAAIIAECERGEDVAKAAYEEALAQPLPPDIRAVLQRQYNGVRQNHDRVRNLREEAQAKAG
jgi:uncharacterized protein (TIGR02284 family)